MDFTGQARAEKIFIILLWTAGVIGFIYGYITERFLHTFLFIFGAFAVSALVCIPSWPFFNKNRLAFQPVKRVAQD
jgi:signal peptidase complex subunit 1